MLNCVTSNDGHGVKFWNARKRGIKNHYFLFQTIIFQYSIANQSKKILEWTAEWALVYLTTKIMPPSNLITFLWLHN